jgi:hypothetical protein
MVMSRLINEQINLKYFVNADVLFVSTYMKWKERVAFFYIVKYYKINSMTLLKSYVKRMIPLNLILFILFNWSD